jgi:WD repeat-containing protein 45
VYLQGLLPLPSYFQSEWSFAQFRLPESGRAIVGFHEGDSDGCCLFVVTQAGGFYRLRLNATEAGTMEQELYESFADSEIPEA